MRSIYFVLLAVLIGFTIGCNPRDQGDTSDSSLDDGAKNAYKDKVLSKLFSAEVTDFNVAAQFFPQYYTELKDLAYIKDPAKLAAIKTELDELAVMAKNLASTATEASKAAYDAKLRATIAMVEENLKGLDADKQKDFKAVSETKIEEAKNNNAVVKQFEDKLFSQLKGIKSLNEYYALKIFLVSKYRPAIDELGYIKDFNDQGKAFDLLLTELDSLIENSREKPAATVTTDKLLLLMADVVTLLKAEFDNKITVIQNETLTQKTELLEYSNIKKAVDDVLVDIAAAKKIKKITSNDENLAASNLVIKLKGLLAQHKFDATPLASDATKHIGKLEKLVSEAAEAFAKKSLEEVKNAQKANDVEKVNSSAAEAQAAADVVDTMNKASGGSEAGDASAEAAKASAEEAEKIRDATNKDLSDEQIMDLATSAVDKLKKSCERLQGLVANLPDSASIQKVENKIHGVELKYINAGTQIQIAQAKNNVSVLETDREECRKKIEAAKLAIAAAKTRLQEEEDAKQQQVLAEAAAKKAQDEAAEAAVKKAQDEEAAKKQPAESAAPKGEPLVSFSTIESQMDPLKNIPKNKVNDLKLFIAEYKKKFDALCVDARVFSNKGNNIPIVLSIEELNKAAIDHAKASTYGSKLYVTRRNNLNEQLDAIAMFVHDSLDNKIPQSKKDAFIAAVKKDFDKYLPDLVKKK